MNPAEVYVNIHIDDLNARSDPKRSQSIGCYVATPEEIQMLLQLARDLRKRVRDQLGDTTPEEEE